MKLLQSNDPVLRDVSVPVVGDMPGSIIFEMENRINLFPDVAGIAAPQLGISQQIIVLKYAGKIQVIMNPCIKPFKSTKIVSAVEGCLSFPGVHLRIERPLYVSVSFLNEDGKSEELTFEGIDASVFLHEYDHLYGILFIDRGQNREMRRKIEREYRVKPLIISTFDYVGVTGIDE